MHPPCRHVLRGSIARNLPPFQRSRGEWRSNAKSLRNSPRRWSIGCRERLAGGSHNGIVQSRDSTVPEQNSLRIAALLVTFMPTYTTIDEYIDNAPEAIRDILRKVRQTIGKAAPKAAETISYGIPTFDLNGKHLVHFAGFKMHIGFFPTSSPISAFKEELAGYKTSKGTIQFPLDKPIPYGLIRKITAFRLIEVTGQTQKTKDTICSRGHAYRGSGPCPVCWPGGEKRNKTRSK